MTRQEAIKILKSKMDGSVDTSYERAEAVRMAIEKLEQESIKFYYVESLDDYWIGRRLYNFYYATWHGRLGFVWSHSKYLPWGEHIVDENTLWKEHTYPSEPKEIPFVEWIIGFTKKYFQQEPKRGKWILKNRETDGNYRYMCSECGHIDIQAKTQEVPYCWYCGASMESDNE